MRTNIINKQYPSPDSAGSRFSAGIVVWQGLLLYLPVRVYLTQHTPTQSALLQSNTLLSETQQSNSSSMQQHYIRVKIRKEGLGTCRHYSGNRHYYTKRFHRHSVAACNRHSTQPALYNRDSFRRARVS